MKLIFEETRPVGLVYRSWRAGGSSVTVHQTAIAQYAKAQRVLVVDLRINAADGSDVPEVEEHERILLTIDTRSEATRKTIEIVDDYYARMSTRLAHERAKYPDDAEAAPKADLS